MEVRSLDLPDAKLFRPLRHGDARGSFVRTWCRDSFSAAGVTFTPVQGNSSITHGRGSLRGMHAQLPPKPDAKIVRVSAGTIHDVIIDLRPDSPAFGRWTALELSGEDPALLYVPPGFAHGFQVLSDSATVEYLMGEAYAPDLYWGFRFDDPAAGIDWPLPPARMSEKDLVWPPLTDRFPQLPPITAG